MTAPTFDDFVRTRTPGLLRVAYLLTGEQHAAEDLVQSALERTAGRWRHLVRNDSADGYVRTVMYRLQVDRWRRRAKFAEQVTAAVPDGAGPDPYGAADTRLALRAALARLTPRQRAVLVLRFFEDLGEARTAEVLGCSAGTVKSQTALALRRLREGAPELADLVGNGVGA
ncbi:MAG TPA: SigE family RNA polymerase sigma factor [Frankiaceae bacterium]|nr:SigE family RNA polymerase sigma factor [Frankiaceae bacterium]